LTNNSTGTLANGQLEAKFFYFIIRLLQSCIRFEQVVLIIRRSNSINRASGVVTVYKWPSSALDGHLQRVTTPKVVLIQFDLLMMMSATLHET